MTYDEREEIVQKCIIVAGWAYRRGKFIRRVYHGTASVMDIKRAESRIDKAIQELKELLK